MAKQPSPNLLLQKERLRHFLTQSELAEVIGVATKTVQRWERGLSSPRAHYVQKLCEYFGKMPEELGFSNAVREEDSRTSVPTPLPAASSDRHRDRRLTCLFVAGSGVVLAIVCAVVWIVFRP